MESGPASLSIVITYESRALVSAFPSIQGMVRTPIPMKNIQKHVDHKLGSSLPHLPQISAIPAQTLQDDVNDLFGMTYIQKKISPCALPLFLVPKKNQSLNMRIDNQTIKITLVPRFPIQCLDYMLGIFFRSSMYFKINLKDRDYQRIFRKVTRPSLLLSRREIQINSDKWTCNQMEL